jgi:hypothetical protein
VALCYLGCSVIGESADDKGMLVFYAIQQLAQSECYQSEIFCLLVLAATYGFSNLFIGLLLVNLVESS